MRFAVIVLCVFLAIVAVEARGAESKTRVSYPRADRAKNLCCACKQELV